MVRCGLLRLGLLAALGTPLACGHAHDTGTNLETQGHETPPRDQPAPHAPAPGEAPPHDRPSEGAAAPPLSTSAAGLLQPGAVQQIQDRLSSRGLLSSEHEAGSLDGPTREALRKLQRDSNIPATGTPDDATVRKLGLAPDQVFKRAE